MKLTIGIPTYNRVKNLKMNLEQLVEIIRNLDFTENIDIYVSDNCSTDDTQQVVKNFIDSNRDIKIVFTRNNQNLGVVKNICNILYSSEAEYLMLLGDDDYISEEYLKNVLNEINQNISCIIPSYMNILPNGKPTGRGRDIDKKSKRYIKGFTNCKSNSWRGHQLSGLVIKRKIIAEQMKIKNVSNLYMQIYWIAFSCLNGNTVHMTEYPIKVTTPPKGGKAWSYGNIGLIPDVFENYKLLDNISIFQRHRLEMKFLREQYWRYAMYIKKGPGKFFKCIAGIVNSKETSIPTKVIFPLTFFFILVGQALKLLFAGKLFRTLKTKVEI